MVAFTGEGFDWAPVGTVQCRPGGFCWWDILSVDALVVNWRMDREALLGLQGPHRTSGWGAAVWVLLV